MTGQAPSPVDLSGIAVSMALLGQRLETLTDNLETLGQGLTARLDGMEARLVETIADHEERMRTLEREHISRTGACSPARMVRVEGRVDKVEKTMAGLKGRTNRERTLTVASIVEGLGIIGLILKDIFTKAP